jgi:signal transduction histidine kinase
MRAVAAAVIDGEDSSAVLQAVPIQLPGQQCAALVARPAPGQRRQCIVCLREAAAMLRPIFEREAQLQASAERERSLVEAGERAFVRLSFDLHDGPVQEVTALALELQGFRGQLARTLPAEAPERALLLGRVDDIAARLGALDSSVRELLGSMDPPAVAEQPLRKVLEAELEAVRSAGRIRAELALSGDFGHLSASQRIALIRVVHEALTNVRRHSGASMATVEVTETDSGVYARVEDDGDGFDVAAASRRGGLGLRGMAERARLLGGSCEIESAPGGPTAVTLLLPHWRPADGVSG